MYARQVTSSKALIKHRYYKAPIFICLAVSEHNVLVPVSVSRGWQPSAQWRSWSQVIQTSGDEASVPSDQAQYLGSLYWRNCH